MHSFCYCLWYYCEFCFIKFHVLIFLCWYEECIFLYIKMSSCDLAKSIVSDSFLYTLFELSFSFVLLPFLGSLAKKVMITDILAWFLFLPYLFIWRRTIGRQVSFFCWFLPLMSATAGLGQTEARPWTSVDVPQEWHWANWAVTWCQCLRRKLELQQRTNWVSVIVVLMWDVNLLDCILLLCRSLLHDFYMENIQFYITKYDSSFISFCR